MEARQWSIWRGGPVAALALALVIGGAWLVTRPALADEHFGAAAERVGELYAMHAETYREAETVLSGGALSKRFFHPLTVLALESGQLDFDPIFYGKDVSFDDIENIEVFPHPDVPIRDGTAFVVVTFQHSGATHQLRYALQRVEGSDTWWIIDIFGSDWSLNKLLLQR